VVRSIKYRRQLLGLHRIEDVLRKDNPAEYLFTPGQATEDIKRRMADEEWHVLTGTHTNENETLS
jgi:hypothetical protein